MCSTSITTVCSPSPDSFSEATSSFYDLILKNCWNNRKSWIVGWSCFLLSVIFFIAREWLLHCNVNHMQSIYISVPGQFKAIGPFSFTAHLSALKPLEEMLDKSPICAAIYKCLSHAMHAFLNRRNNWKRIVFMCETCGWIIIIINITTTIIIIISVFSVWVIVCMDFYFYFILEFKLILFRIYVNTVDEGEKARGEISFSFGYIWANLHSC